MIRVGNDWIPIEEHIVKHSEAESSHGLCPEFKAKHYGSIF